MNLDNIKTDFNKLLKDYKERKSKLAEAVKSNFFGLFEDVFSKYPHIGSFSWKQYTDYFNDGDTCTFSVHADADYGLEINHQQFDGRFDELYGDQIYDDMPSGGSYWCSPTYERLKEEVQTPYVEISDLIYEVPSEIMEDVFGDHVQVTVFRDGNIAVDDYSSHD